MAKRREHTESFADIVEQVKARPASVARVPVGLHQGSWGDRDGNRYELVTDDLSPEAVLELAKAGATAVYDACGCGGNAGCTLDWLTAIDVAGLAEAGPPEFGSRPHAHAALEHWRSRDGKDLIVLADDVYWGDRING
jgi:hypothetical protein